MPSPSFFVCFTTDAGVVRFPVTAEDVYYPPGAEQGYFLFDMTRILNGRREGTITGSALHVAYEGQPETTHVLSTTHHRLVAGRRIVVAAPRFHLL